MEISLAKVNVSYKRAYLVFQVLHVCCFSENNQLKTINMPKRHILGWQILAPYKAHKDTNDILLFGFYLSGYESSF